MINYDAVTSNSDTVTRGVGQHLETIIVFRDWGKLPSGTHPLFSGLLDAIQELEKLVGHDSLDIEFAISRDGVINILQLRPITIDYSARFSDEQFSNLLCLARDQFLEFQKPSPFIFGEKTFFGIMPDWNPAQLKEMGFPFDLKTLESFMRDTIEGREYAKFVFSRNLSKALDYIVGFGLDHRVSREQLSHVAIEDFRAAAIGIPAPEISQWFHKKAEEGSLRHEMTQAVESPPVLFEVDDLFAFQLPKCQPNFVGRGKMIGQILDLEKGISKGMDLTGKIILIPQADPGFDWLFGKQIAGLVTMYGGPNSHMAIRTAEFGLPAAIGIGESEYKRISHASVVELDCAHRCLRIIQ